MQRPILLGCFTVLGSLPLVLWAQDLVTVGDLQARSPTVLTRDELQALLPAASMSRVNEKGSTHRWKNEPGGEMVVSSDNAGGNGRGSTARASWRLADDGRYCLNVEWKRGETEASCRLILKAGDAYYAVDELEPATRKVQRLEIRR